MRFTTAILATLASAAAFVAAETTITHTPGVINSIGTLTLRLDAPTDAQPALKAGELLELQLAVPENAAAYSSGGLPLACNVNGVASPFAGVAEGILALEIPEGMALNDDGQYVFECSSIKATDKDAALNVKVLFGEAELAAPKLTIAKPAAVVGPSFRIVRVKGAAADAPRSLFVHVPALGAPLNADKSFLQVQLAGATFADGEPACTLTLNKTHAAQHVAFERAGADILLVDAGSVVIPAKTSLDIACVGAVMPFVAPAAGEKAPERTGTISVLSAAHADLLAQGSAQLKSAAAGTAAGAAAIVAAIAALAALL